MSGISPVLLAALIQQLGIPELMRWLAELHAQDRVVTEVEALDKLGMDVDTGNAAGLAFLQAHAVPPTI